MKKEVSRCLLITFCFLATLSSSRVCALVIDDFTQGGVTLTDPLGSGSVSDLKVGLDSSHIAPTARHLTFNAIDPFPSGDTGAVTVEVDTAGTGAFRHLPDTGLAAANFFVSYGNTSLGLPAMSLDFLADGADRLSFDFSFTDPNPGGFGDFAMGVVVASGNGSSFNTFMPIPTSNVPFTVDITFADMLSSSPMLDLSDITMVRFGTSNGTLDGPFEITKVHTIPEPTSLTLAGLFSIAALARVRWSAR